MKTYRIISSKTEKTIAELENVHFHQSEDLKLANAWIKDMTNNDYSIIPRKDIVGFNVSGSSEQFRLGYVMTDPYYHVYKFWVEEKTLCREIVEVK